MKKKSVNNISAEVLAAFLDGNVTAQESKEILNALAEDAELRELLHISQSVDAELGLIPQDCEFIPMTAMAATCNEENYCCLECEKFILRKLDIEFNEEQLLQNAIRNGWQKEDGTALHNVGRHLESKGLVVTRQYNALIKDIANALDENECVIVAVDGGELLGNRADETVEDLLIGQIPDHTVVVLSLDAKKSTITLFISSSDSNNSIFTAKEVALAFNAGKYIIPYKIDNSSFSKKLQFVMTDLNCIDATPYSTQKAKALVADIKSLLYGERKEEVFNVEEREYIDVLQWNEPQNKILRFIKRIFDDK